MGAGFCPVALRLRGPTCSVGRVSVSATRQLQLIAVARNHLLIPVERFLLAAVQRAVAFIVFIDKDKASIGMLQRVLRIGHNRACRIVDQLEEAGVVGPDEGTKPRKVLMSMEAFEQYIDEYV